MERRRLQLALALPNASEMAAAKAGVSQCVLDGCQLIFEWDMRDRVNGPDTSLELLAGEDEQGLYIVLVRNQRHADVVGHGIMSVDKMMLVVIIEVVEVMQHRGQHMHIVVTEVDLTVLCLLENSLILVNHLNHILEVRDFVR